MEQQRPPAGAAGTPAPATPAAPTRPARRWRGTIIALLVVAGLGALAWYLTHRAPAGGANAARRGGPPPTTVGVAAAAASDIPVYVDALGTVTPPATVTVTPQVSGVLTRVAFEEGQMVKAGQVLATIDPRPFQFALMQAQGAQERDEAQLDSARVTLQRYQTLLKQDSIARQDVDTQAATVKQLEGTVLGDKAAVGTARLNLEWSTVTAPVSGRIGLRVVDVGNLVAANSSTGVAVITELAPIDVEFAVPQDRIPQLQARITGNAHLPVTAYDRTRTQVLDIGTFLSLNNQTDTQTGTVRAKARFTNAKSTLFPSQFVNVRILLDTVHGATTVPVTAVRHGPDGDFVYVLGNDRTVAVRKVTQGQSTPELTQITSGLAVGERVITEGGDRLKDGAKVVLPGDVPASGGAGRGARWASGASGAGHGASGASGASHRHHGGGSAAGGDGAGS